MMHRIRKLLPVALLAAPLALAAASKAVTVNFARFAVDDTPPGFSVALTGDDRLGTCAVKADKSAPGGKALVLKPAPNVGKTETYFPLCVYEGFTGKDVEASVRFKAVSGYQVGGLAVRYQEKDNYYVVRASALEDNVRLYKVVKSHRLKIEGVDRKLAKDKWYTLALSVHGDKLTVLLDGRKLFSATDKTFKKAGKVGLWSKDDAVAHYADLRIRPL